MKALKVGILGYGKMGQVYGRWFQEHPGCEVVAVYNHSEGKREKVKEDIPDAEYYTDWKELIRNPQIDAVGICSATYEKCEQICEAIDAKKHVICEKPICMDLDELEQIKAHYDGSGIKFLVASELRLHPVIETVTRLIPDIGQIFHISLDYSMYRDEVKWKHKLEAGGGILRELGQHLLDVANGWLGEPRLVFGKNIIINPERQVEDFSMSIVEYQSGALVRLTSHYYEHETNTYNGAVYGSNGQINFRVSSYDPKQAWVKYYDHSGMREISISTPKDIDNIYPGHLDSFKREIDGFVDAITEDRPVANGIHEEERTLQIMCASYASGKSGCQMTLPISGFNRLELLDCYKRL